MTEPEPMPDAEVMAAVTAALQPFVDSGEWYSDSFSTSDDEPGRTWTFDEERADVWMSSFPYTYITIRGECLEVEINNRHYEKAKPAFQAVLRAVTEL